ncbi:hypothetical protein H2200_001845 [Cladophialophora chaetospira]|uniref:Xaa-Pro dipeptidyl-peptidase C-terminal domain-containing protein n=1 Tax=Cladophialophora chaetospira TaxID=386627 RepID=A0AA38XLS6_9EURO|nr:hypothetical protein H2200_001845 [Cladophialophora chaetospira]
MGAATAFPLPLGLAVNEIGGSMVIPVMTDTTLCLSVIAAWKAVQFLAGQTSAYPHLSYEAQALQSLRHKLIVQGQAAVTDEAILAASLLWATGTMFAQQDALRRHATGVRALVTARGGLRCIGSVGEIGQAASIKQLILWADFLTAQFLGEEVHFEDIGPAYSMPPSLLKLSKAITIPPHIANLRPTTLKAVREMKLLLVSHDAATRTCRVSIAEYKALMSLLNHSTIERINLEHHLKNSDSPDECLMLAMNLMRLTVLFHAGPLFTIVISVISRLRNALKRTTLKSFIEISPEGINLYIWACFIGLVNDFDNENRAYFIEMLSSAMDTKYEESSWPEGWRTQTLDMLRSFIWSDTVLTRLYFEACHMIEALRTTNEPPRDFHSKDEPALMVQAVHDLIIESRKRYKDRLASCRNKRSRDYCQVVIWTSIAQTKSLLWWQTMALSDAEVFSVAGIEVIQKRITSIDDPHAKSTALSSSSTTLPKGFKKDPSRRGFEAATIWDRDIEVPMRDGVVLRADVFRPAEATEKVPALLVWSPYGKSGTGFLSLDVVPGRVGVPESALSGLESFEAPDPAEWTAHGYAVVNVDARGIMRWNGTAEGRDGYDTIEYLADLPWCNGHVGLIGVSWLAMAQWYIAAERPPHLSCMLPLEGLRDTYRESLCRGGVPYLPFWHFLRDHGLYGENLQEDPIAMLAKYPLMNGYWEDKRARVELINVPAYVLASMSTGLHTIGSTRGFEDIPHDKKWLRFHASHEWRELYQEDNTADLKKFLDFYTKGIKNDWEATPKARIPLIRYNKSPVDAIPFSDWPIPETLYKQLWLSNDQSLREDAAATVSGEASYQSDIQALQADDDPEFVEFVYTFTETSTLIGYPKAVLYLSCPDHDDMDIFVIIRKADKNGKVLRNVNIPLHELGAASEAEVETINSLKYIGPSGVLRASHRAIDPKLSKPHWPAHDHTREEKIPAGQVVKLEIGIWPAAIQFEAGEKLVFRIAGHQMVLAEFPPLRGQFKTGNKGRHVLHVGGEYDSHIVVPFVPV